MNWFLFILYLMVLGIWGAISNQSIKDGALLVFIIGGISLVAMVMLGLLQLLGQG